MLKRLKTLYKNQIVPELIKKFGYTNTEQVPKLVKISINRGLGEGSKNAQELKVSTNEIAMISGQLPASNQARKSIAGFKLRQGMLVGSSVTLRSGAMYMFLLKLIHFVLPRVRDFRGISPNGFDGKGNFNFGLKDQLAFPEISYDEVVQLDGFDISIVTTAKTDEEALFLLKSFGFPFKTI
jgi:large subunit ribosomal protein L5